MKQSTHIKQFEAYLNKKLDEQEHLAFKEQLKTDPLFKKEFLQYLLSLASWSNSKLDVDREMMKQVYAELQPKPYQKPDQVYLFKRFVSDHLKTISVAASLLLLVSVTILLYQDSSTSSEQILAQLFIEPVSMERASAVEKKFFEKASYFYYQDKPLIDSLEAHAAKSTGFSIPKYYLAHAYFKNKEYKKALEMFESCLGNLDYINQVPQLQGSDADLRFNTVLAKAALNKDKTELLKELDAIEKSIEPTHPLMEKLNALRKKLK